MRHLFIITILSLLIISATEKTEDVVYLIPKEVSKHLDQVLFNDSKNNSKYICLFNNVFDTTSILFINVDQSEEKLLKIASHSNHKLSLGNRKIPIIFYSDFKFSTIFNKLNDDNTFTSTSYKLGGYLVIFTGKFTTGKLIYCGNDY